MTDHKEPAAKRSRPAPPDDAFTPNTLRAMMTKRPDAADVAYPYLSAAMREFSITKRLREAAFLATVAHESAEFRYLAEIWCPTSEQLRYEPPSAKAVELGNTEHGDGFRFRGRGPIRITGRDNYIAASKALDHDFVGDPDALAEPEFSFRAAAWWWQEHHCNELADLPDFAAVTHCVNVGMDGWEQRLDYYKRALVLIPPDAPVSFSNIPVAHLRPKEAARRYGVSISWLWAACSTSDPKRKPVLTPPKKLGSRISLFDAELLDREMAALLCDRGDPSRAA